MEAHEERRLSDVIKGCVLPSLRKQQNTNAPETCCWWNGIEMFVVWTWSELHPRRVTHVHSWCSVYYSCYLIIRWITVYQSLYYISQNPFGRPACSIQLLDRNHEMNENGWSAPTPRTTTEPATGEQTVVTRSQSGSLYDDVTKISEL